MCMNLSIIATLISRTALKESKDQTTTNLQSTWYTVKTTTVHDRRRPPSFLINKKKKSLGECFRDSSSLHTSKNFTSDSQTRMRPTIPVDLYPWHANQKHQDLDLGLNMPKTGLNIIQNGFRHLDFWVPTWQNVSQQLDVVQKWIAEQSRCFVLKLVTNKILNIFRVCQTALSTCMLPQFAVRWCG